MKPVVHRPTEEEKLAQRAQIYLQKQESYALNAALKMLEGKGIPTKDEVEQIVEIADFFAETMLKKLFMKPDEDSKDSDNKADK